MKINISVMPMLDYGDTNTTLGPVFLFRVIFYFMKERSLSSL